MFIKILLIPLCFYFYLFFVQLAFAQDDQYQSDLLAAQQQSKYNANTIALENSVKQSESTVVIVNENQQSIQTDNFIDDSNYVDGFDMQDSQNMPNIEKAMAPESPKTPITDIPSPTPLTITNQDSSDTQPTPIIDNLIFEDPTQLILPTQDQSSQLKDSINPTNNTPTNNMNDGMVDIHNASKPR